uniref:ADAMTS-like 3 n=1 Tax=Pundamilia nyererei TaxID=303518 RepID=A0A3B4GUV9_9CICH
WECCRSAVRRLHEPFSLFPETLGLFLERAKLLLRRMTRSDEDREIGWDAWGAWSDCSRTCGGGASYSLRRCLNGGSCEGKNIRYRTCSNTDCPAESGDFRAQQCSAHNDIKYQGVTYEWVPAPYDPTAPCALRCQAKGRSLTVELAPKVLDGTRCRADAFDMCISGVCQVKDQDSFTMRKRFPCDCSERADVGQVFVDL